MGGVIARSERGVLPGVLIALLMSTLAGCDAGNDMEVGERSPVVGEAPSVTTETVESATVANFYKPRPTPEPQDVQEGDFVPLDKVQLDSHLVVLDSTPINSVLRALGGNWLKEGVGHHSLSFACYRLPSVLGDSYLLIEGDPLGDDTVDGVRWSVSAPHVEQCEGELGQPDIDIGPGLHLGLSRDSARAILGKLSKFVVTEAAREEYESRYGELGGEFDYFLRIADKRDYALVNEAMVKYDGDVATEILLWVNRSY